MNFWEYLDRAGERRLRTGPADARLVIGFGFLAGYYALIFYLAGREALANADMVRDALLVLGPPVGAIVAALFRTDARDVEQTANTGRAFKAIEAAAAAGNAAPVKVDPPATITETRTTKVDVPPEAVAAGLSDATRAALTPAKPTPEETPWA